MIARAKAAGSWVWNVTVTLCVFAYWYLVHSWRGRTDPEES